MTILTLTNYKIDKNNYCKIEHPALLNKCNDEFNFRMAIHPFPAAWKLHFHHNDQQYCNNC